VAAQFEGPDSTGRADVGNDGRADTPHQADLADRAGAHPARTDKANLDRFPLLGAPIQCLLEHHTPGLIE
jgi:hypothetical protein